MYVHQFSGDIVTVEFDGDSFVASGNHPVWVIEGKGLADRPAAKDVPWFERQAYTNGCWLEARSLEVGDVLLAESGQSVNVERISSCVGIAPVYNIRVQHDHTYAVTKHAILVHNKAAQIAPISQTPEGTIQYSLRANANGFYPVMLRGESDQVFVTYLQEGDVWKFGTTTDPATRYPLSKLNSIGEHGVQMVPEFSGTEQQAVILQNMKIENYLAQKGYLPPGNKIIN